MFISELVKNIPIEKPVIATVADLFKAQNGLNAYYSSDNFRNMLYEKLADLGWTQVKPVGHFSTAFINDSKPYIIKINFIRDTAYFHFIELCRKNTNKHFPDVSNIVEYTGKGKTFYMYLMEKLYPAKISIWQLYWMKQIAKNPEMSLAELFKADMDELGTPKIIQDLKRIRAFYAIRHDPEMVKAMKLLGSEKENNEFDLEPKNIMQRKDGTLVIIDPYWNPEYEEI